MRRDKSQIRLASNHGQGREGAGRKAEDSYPLRVDSIVRGPCTQQVVERRMNVARTLDEPARRTHGALIRMAAWTAAVPMGDHHERQGVAGHRGVAGDAEQIDPQQCGGKRPRIGRIPDGDRDWLAARVRRCHQLQANGTFVVQRIREHIDQQCAHQQAEHDQSDADGFLTAGLSLLIEPLLRNPVVRVFDQHQRR